jgi:4-diphosphocytidyl-2-C-methyl-D-erythritol kinase
MADTAMSAIRVDAPAKINLGLRIVGRRDDGYHLLESLFVPLELADGVRIEIESGSGSGDATPVDLVVSGAQARAHGGDAEVPTDGRNLAVRAARAWLEAAGPAAGVARVRIELEKRIPAAAGLGGGSSDAAAVLRGLGAVCPAGPQAEVLDRIALGLGADVPFFLDPVPSRVSGIGDRIEPFPGLARLGVVLVNPGISLSTAEVYRLYDEVGGASEDGLTAPDPGPTMRALSGLGADPKALARLPGFSNDLEVAAVRLCPPVARLRDLLREAGALHAGMSGSGATVFGLFEGEAEAAAALKRIEPGGESWTCVTSFRIDGTRHEENESEQGKRRK